MSQDADEYHLRPFLPNATGNLCNIYKGHHKVLRAGWKSRQDLQLLDQETIAFGSPGLWNPNAVSLLVTDVQEVSIACHGSVVDFLLTCFKLETQKLCGGWHSKLPSRRVAVFCFVLFCLRWMSQGTISGAGSEAVPSPHPSSPSLPPALSLHFRCCVVLVTV